MHELGIAQEVIAIVAEHAGAARVTRVVLEIGQHAMILPDSIRFCFDLCSEGTVAQGARARDPRRARPGLVAAIVARKSPWSSPSASVACGSADLQWLSGDEIKVKEMELA